MFQNAPCKQHSSENICQSWAVIDQVENQARSNVLSLPHLYQLWFTLVKECFTSILSNCSKIVYLNQPLKSVKIFQDNEKRHTEIKEFRLKKILQKWIFRMLLAIRSELFAKKKCCSRASTWKIQISLTFDSTKWLVDSRQTHNQIAFA